MNLELMAMKWLWLEKNCHYVLRERCPRWGCGSPDVLGVTAARYMIEIEVKRSASDFAADFRKRHRVNRPHYLDRAPKQFYYLMPHDLADKVESRVPEWAGLMSAGGDDCVVPRVRKTAPVNTASKRLSIKECIKLVRLITNHLMSSEERNESFISSRTYGDVWPYWFHQPGYIDYQV